MRRILLLIFGIISLNSVAQFVSGTVLSEAGDTIPFALVNLYADTSTQPILGVYGDESGNFKIELPNGNEKYLIGINALGFVNYKTAPFTGSTNLGDLYITKDANMINVTEIVIAKELIQSNGRGIDVDVSASPLLESSNAKEILSRIPGVVMNQDGTFTLNGQSNIQIFINGKPTFLSLEQLVQQLESTPGSDIEKIEVFNTPPAKFDAEGAGGIINIIKKKNTSEGFNANTGINAGMGRYPKSNAWFNFNYRKKKFNLFGNINGNRDTHFFTQGFELNSDINNVKSEIHNSKIPEFTNQNIGTKLGIDYEIDTNTTIGIMVSPYIGNFVNYEELDAFVIQGNYNYDKNLGYRDMTNVWRGNVYNLNFERKIKKGSWSFDTDYIYNFSASDQITESDYYFESAIIGDEQYNTNWDAQLRAIASKLDFEKTLKKDWNIETGLKYIALNQTNDFYSDFKDGSSSWINTINFAYNERIAAGYFSAFKKLNKKWKADIGLRAEHTVMDGKTDVDSIKFNQQFFNIFPNASVNYEASENWNHSLSFTRRIKRPEYLELTPFEQRLNPFLISIGNPNLKPQLFNQLGYALSFHKYFNFNVNYALTTNSAFLTPTSNEGELIQRFQFQNLGENHNINASISGPIKPNKWWTVLWNGTVFRNQLVNSPGFNFDYTTFHVRLQNQFNLKKGWKAEFIGFYHHKHFWQVWYQDEFIRFDASLSKKYKNWKFNLIGTDIFGLRVHNGGYNQGAVNSINSFVPERQVFRLSVAFNFGNQHLKKQRNRGTGADDVKERTSN